MRQNVGDPIRFDDQMTTCEKAGRPYERLVAAVQKKFGAGVDVFSPYIVVGKAGSRITLDVAVVGRTTGSEVLLIAIEAKDYTEPVGVEKVRAFCTVKQDLGASHAIMFAPTRFTRDAILTAAAFGIETCLLRPARDEDWDGLIRHTAIDVILMKHVFRDAAIELADGRRIPVPEHGRVWLIGYVNGGDEPLSFGGLVNRAIANQPELDNKDVLLYPAVPLWFPEGSESRLPVARLLCRRDQVEGARQNILMSSREDYIFVKQTPEGDVDERHFLEFTELDKIADTFRRRS